ncbi:MAG: hypothetical protein IPK93_08910 [Solirubrobacterales bacterium]|nr:hypothetical protein [Solirubrobacterales bacterium]
MNVRLIASLTGICVALMMLTGAHAASAVGKTVGISGKAYVFNHMDTGISGATIKVRELPKLSATTDEFGDYVLKVPDDTNVTPYILSGEGLLTKRKFEGGSPTGRSRLTGTKSTFRLSTPVARPSRTPTSSHRPTVNLPA